MARVVESLPAKGHHSPVDSRWDEWFDGQPRLFEPGVDFNSAPRRFRATAISAATRRGLKLRTRVCTEGVYLQAVR